MAQNECGGFYHFIEDVEEVEKKRREAKPDRSETLARSRDDNRTPEIKGIASALKPEEITTSVVAQDISLWLERWEEYKNNSSF